MEEIIDKSIVRCNGGHWVRKFATEEIETIENGEAFVHFWCLSCLKEIDELTEEAVKRPSEYPRGTDPWDDNANKENK